MTATEELAFVRNPLVGGRDVGRPVLAFDVAGEGWGALQIFELDSETARELIASVYNVKELGGKPCVVSREGNIVRFVRMVKT